jgi:hypothetical protein
MPSLFVVLISLVAERRYLGFYAEVFLSASIFVGQEPASRATATRNRRERILRSDGQVQ